MLSPAEFALIEESVAGMKQKSLPALKKAFLAELEQYVKTNKVADALRNTRKSSVKDCISEINGKTGSGKFEKEHMVKIRKKSESEKADSARKNR